MESDHYSSLFFVKLILDILICALAPDFGSGSASLHGSFRIRDVNETRETRDSIKILGIEH